jgi:hypothetical protein
MAIEPNAEGRGYYPYGLQQWTSDYSFMYSFIATILIAFYWYASQRHLLIILQGKDWSVASSQPTKKSFQLTN